MAKLYFRYGAMGASKTANALMLRYNYEEKGKNAILIKPLTDTRDGKYMIRSRIGLRHPCHNIDYLKNFIADVKSSFGDRWRETISDSVDIVISDESQFFTEEEIDFLSSIVDDFDIPVVCYGLRTDFKGNLFPASARLLALADVIEEVPTICWCGRKAQMNARVIDGVVVREGEQIVLGSNDLYVGLCRKHFNEGKLCRTPLEEIFPE